MTAITTKLTI